MSLPPARTAIRLKGVRQNNLKNFDLALPLNRLIVVTGLSGSGKSSLAFDTLFAEGQRRYIETFSPYARQFLDRMDKPQVDSIEGIPPAIAIEQRNAVKTTRSTIGTMTEICDHMKVLWPHLATLHCRSCGRPVRKEPPRFIWQTLNAAEPGAEMLITFDLPLSEKLSFAESLALVARQGYQRLLVEGKVVRVEELGAVRTPRPTREDTAPYLACLTVVQDRLRLASAQRARFVEACEQAYHFGKGILAVRKLSATDVEAPRLFSNRLHCAPCNLEYREPSSALFSFNHPLGACPPCRGFGRIISIDYNLAIPDRSRTLAEGVVKPWLTGLGAECQDDMMRMCRRFKVPMNVPFEQLPAKWQDFVIEGEPGYGKDDNHQWPHAWYGVKGYFRWLESKAYKMHVRVLLSRYRAYTPCPDCRGTRFQPESLLYLVPNPLAKTGRGEPQPVTLAHFYQLPIRDALRFIDHVRAGKQLPAHDPVGLVLAEVRSRLGYLDAVGLGYLTLDRPTRSLSGGETERVNLTTSLGSRLVNTLFVLDEPSVGLHPRDTGRLVEILRQLREAGNTVLVVEHEASVMRAADQIIDLGPGHGATGGNVVFQGSFQEILKDEASLTGKYLSGRENIPVPARRPVPEDVPALHLAGVSLHNLENLAVRIPLGRFVCVTGVSGSGKSTLVREILFPALAQQLKPGAGLAATKASERLDTEEGSREGDTNEAEAGTASATLKGAGQLAGVLLVDQAILGKTPRSNPAVYIGAFDDIREFYAASPVARRRGYNASAFSFNSAQGQCERCRGAGFEKIEMQFLSDIFIRCPECDGRRFRPHILEVKLSTLTAPRPLSIADLLDATVEEAIQFLSGAPESKTAQRAATSLRWLVEVGLGYLKLGQPINTLSGGESQRLKLVRHLATEFAGVAQDAGGKGTLFLFDEPTTGLHFDDIRLLLQVFQKLVEAGHSVLVIEHNIDVIKSADWVIDLGPDAGDAGGKLVAEGSPEAVAAQPGSHTGAALREVLQPAPATAKARRQSGKEVSRA